MDIRVFPKLADIPRDPSLSPLFPFGGLSRGAPRAGLLIVRPSDRSCATKTPMTAALSVLT